MSSFHEKVQSLVQRIEENNAWRQKESINHIFERIFPLELREKL